jgi:hypothetical protein
VSHSTHDDETRLKLKNVSFKEVIYTQIHARCGPTLHPYKIFKEVDDDQEPPRERQLDRLSVGYWGDDVHTSLSFHFLSCLTFTYFSSFVFFWTPISPPPEVPDTPIRGPEH